MVKLFCAMVGAAGSTFLVDIDAGKSVGHLKKVIKADKMFQFPVDGLQLFLAKKNGTWLTENEVRRGVSDTSGLKPLDAARAELRLVGLTNAEVDDVDKAADAAGDGPVNVLVKVPDQAPQATGGSASIRLAGPEVDFTGSSCDGLLAFLEGEMINRDDILSSPRILDDGSLEFRLVGREEAMDKAAECFTDIIEMAKRGALNRIKNAIPVCSGISGLGKTRMLEEGGTILREKMKLDHQRVISVTSTDLAPTQSRS